MMLFVWQRATVGKPYPALWYTAIPAKGEGEPDSRNRVLQSHLLTEAEQNELDRLPNGVARLDYLAAKYPFHTKNEPEKEVAEPVDSTNFIDRFAPAIDAAVDAYRHKQRRNDGQTAHIDRENW